MKEVLEREPENPEALNYLGYTYADLGINLDEAEALITKALEYQPDDGYIVDSLGWVYYKKGRYEEALKELSRAQSLSPDDPVINEHLGDVKYRLGYIDEVLPLYLRAWELGPEDYQIDMLKKKIDYLKGGKSIDDLI